MKEEVRQGLSCPAKMPNIVVRIFEILKNHYINIPEKVILNILISKIAQMLTCKRLKFDESGRINIPNWYSLLFIQSGGGKDRIVKDFDKFVFADFNAWFIDNANKFYQKQLQDAENTAIDVLVDSKNSNKGESKNEKISSPF